MKYIAVIGDIVSSTQILDRASLQHSLSAILNYINRDAELASPYTITLGDEFQALFRRANSLIVDAVRILAHIHPQRVRFAFGIGTILTDINPERAIGMDGPAFHEARRAIAEISDTRYLFNIRGLSPQSEPLVRDALLLLSLLMRKWNKNRLEIFTRLYDGQPVAEIADRLGVSVQAVYKAIDTGDTRMILKLSNSITNWINAGMDET